MPKNKSYSRITNIELRNVFGNLLLILYFTSNIEYQEYALCIRLKYTKIDNLIMTLDRSHRQTKPIHAS